MQGVTPSVFQCAQVWNPLGIVGVITAFNFPCAVLGIVPPPWLLITRVVLVASNQRTSVSICRVIFPCKSYLCHVLLHFWCNFLMWWMGYGIQDGMLVLL